MTTSDDDGLTTGLALLGGGVAGYAAGRFLLARYLAKRDRATAPTGSPAVAASAPLALASSTALIDPYPEAAPTATPATATATPSTHEPSHSSHGASTAPASVASPVDPYPVTAPGTAPPMTKPARVPSKPPLSRAFDPVFETYRGSIPIEFLRALVTRESGMDPAERKGPAWGLMQIIEAVRLDYNKKHKTTYTREHLLDPRVNVAIGCWLLRTIIKSYEKHHADVPNLRTDWTNRRWSELLVFGWNAGYSERGGVGKVAHYLKTHGLPVHLDNIRLYADFAGASRHLQRRDKLQWSKSVVDLYLAEREATAQAGTTRAA